MDRFELVDDVARQSFDFDSLKDSLNIMLNKSKSISFDEFTDMSLKTNDFKRSPPSNPNSFPLSRAILHEQLFGKSEPRETRHDRSYSVPDIPVPNSVFEFSRNETIQAPKSSPGVIGANYSYPSPTNTSMPVGQPSYGERHHINLPSLDVNSRYTLPPSLHHVVNGSYSNSNSNSNTNSNNSPAPTFTGKTYPANLSNVSIAISPSYHAQFAPYTPRSNPMTPHKSPHGNGRENPNLHYRPNRDVQIANLAKAKAAAEGNSNNSSGNNSSGTSNGNSPVPTADTSTTTTTTNTASMVESEDIKNCYVKDTSLETLTNVKLQDKKPTVTYVYTVQQKTSIVYCLISNACSLYALSMNELVVFSIDDFGGEEIGFVSQIVTMKVFCEQNQVTELEATNKMKFIVRAATEADRKETAKNRLEEADIIERLFDTNNRVYRLPISIVDAQYQLDRKRLTICYKELHEGVIVDGRELMKDLFQLVQTRIVMKRLLSTNNNNNSNSR